MKIGGENLSEPSSPVILPNCPINWQILNIENLKEAFIKFQLEKNKTTRL